MLREHCAPMKCWRLSIQNTWMKNRAGDCGCSFLKQVIPWIVLGWSWPPTIPGTRTLCPMAWRPGFLYHWLFWAKHIIIWRWSSVGELKKPSTCLINIFHFLWGSVQGLCCPESHFQALDWGSDPGLSFQHRVLPSTHAITWKWSASAWFPFQGRHLVSVPCAFLAQGAGPGTVGTYHTTVWSDVGSGPGIQRSLHGRNTVRSSWS